MKDKLLHIRERFPDSIDTMASLAAKSTDFSDLCEDYNDCVRAMRHWACSNDPGAKEKFNEYLTLVQDLEREIIQTLSPNQQLDRKS
jgi:hypothetical protein